MDKAAYFKKIYPLSQISLILLSLFLPFSSWLISLTGTIYFTFIRDLLWIGWLIPASIIYVSTKKSEKNNPLLLLGIVLILWYVLGFFWREASILQWLKGARFTLPPLTFLLLGSINLRPPYKKWFTWSVYLGLSVVLFFAVLQLFGKDIPLITAISGKGALVSINRVAGFGALRISSILAGPNAFALYVLTTAGLITLFSSFKGKILLFFLPLLSWFSYSRSGFVGLTIFLIGIVSVYVYQKRGYITLFIFLAITVTLLGSGLSVFSHPDKRYVLTHAESTTQRIEQYHRIWDQRYDIGLWGRGLGTAGPAAQYRLDNKDGSWTENIYLDTFEEIGLIGIGLYICFFIALLRKLFLKRYWVQFFLLLSFSIIGMFINYTTGQVGWYLCCMVVATELNHKND